MAEAGAVAAGAAARRVAEAVKASGAIVEVEPKSFTDILAKVNKPLVVMALGGAVKKNYRYLVEYKVLSSSPDLKPPWNCLVE
ncbi:MAG: hypothetical protein QW797_08735 [Thermoproteota archaeon]